VKQVANLNYDLINVGIKGNDKIELKDGKALFTGLKFRTTSYNNEVH